MNDIRQRVLRATKQELAKKPFVNGNRITMIGLMSSMFDGLDEDQVVAGMSELAEDMKKFGLILGSHPQNANVLLAVEKER